MLLPNFSRRRLLIFRVLNASLYAFIWVLQVQANQWTTIMWLLTALVIAIGGTMTWQW
ncbi:hypothetical protein [Levilactobacillus cerevisiae]|uniref:hypothetical protein n=1 Tax=Levilactobacillus cerevisiae TaxID=1704076 RepID=UPI0013DE1937|nr:hypothetical protein [Levilactobacillus cerevisiae]